MSDRLPAGPYRQLLLDNQVSAPFYIMPFDKRGLCQAPETRAHLLKAVADGGYSDIFLFSHGWNNDWTAATHRYNDFLTGFMKQRRDSGLPFPAAYKPLLLGVFWPSTALVFGDSEKGPAFSMAGAGEVDETLSQERRELDELAAALSPAQAETLYRLAQKTELTMSEAHELAEVAVVLCASRDDELGDAAAISADGLLKVWLEDAEEEDDLADLIADGGGGVQPAGIGDAIKKLDPRHLVRLLTVAQMKDRAGVVGANGVGPLLREILAASNTARMHLIGHSYGAKVVLAATCGATALPRKLRSMLLLQPAVSHLCFANLVPGSGQPGGYRSALQRVENPILSTFSAHDVALTKTFHLALRRDADLGERGFSAAGAPPSKFAALGGFGPRGAGETLVPIRSAGQAYALDDAVRIYGIDGTAAISGHGDISNPATWWALHSLVSR